MSRFNRLWVLLVPMVLLFAGLGVTPAHATDWNPPAPVPSDVCGTQQDRFYVPTDDQTDYYYNGQVVGQGTWQPTGGTSAVNVVARTWSDPDKTFAMSFSAESNSTCVEAADTVTTEIVACNTTNKGTRVKFTYTNTDDPTNWFHTRPEIWVDRWDGKQSAYVVPTYGQVADGASVSITGGDHYEAATAADEFYLSPGTYKLQLGTAEYARRLLSNRLFVPACGGLNPPAGDPMGGPIVTPPPPVVSRPTAVINACNVRTNRVRVLLDARKATKTVKYRLVIDPRRGSTVKRTYYVAAKQYKTIVLRKQRTGTLITVSFADKVVQRRLRC